MVYMDRVDIVVEYDVWVYFLSIEIKIFFVVVFRDYVKLVKCVVFMCFNFFLRDEFCC